MDNNADKCFVMNQMGRVDISVTEMYYHQNQRELDKKAAIINILVRPAGDCHANSNTL